MSLGYRIRPAGAADAAAISHVRVESWRTTYRGIVPDDFLDAMSAEAHVERTQRFLSADGVHTFVAEADVEVVGFAICGAERSGHPDYDGEVYGIYLLLEHQRQGVGRRLLSSAAEALRQAGMRAVLIWVLE